MYILECRRVTALLTYCGILHEKYYDRIVEMWIHFQTNQQDLFPKWIYFYKLFTSIQTKYEHVIHLDNKWHPACNVYCRLLNIWRPRRNEQHFADDILKRIFFNESVWISIKISMKFVPNDPIGNIPALVQTMAWRRSGDKPLSEPMMVSLPSHICITRPQ